MHQPSPKIVEYQNAVIAPPVMEIRRDGADLAIVIAPQHFTRSMVIHTVRSGLFLGLATIFGSVMLWNADSGARMWAGIFGAGLAALLVRSLLRLAFFARHGSTPAVIRVSAATLSVHAKAMGREGYREWSRAQIADVSFRHAGAMPGLLPYVRIQVSFYNDAADTICIPSSGAEPLAVIEDNVRDALGLPPTTSPVQSTPPRD